MNESARIRSDWQEKDILNATEAAVYLGANPYTIRNLAKRGQLPGRKVGKEWKFSKRQLLAWLENER